MPFSDRLTRPLVAFLAVILMPSDNFAFFRPLPLFVRFDELRHLRLSSLLRLALVLLFHKNLLTSHNFECIELMPVEPEAASLATVPARKPDHTKSSAECLMDTISLPRCKRNGIVA
jgi:hypothetical protein